MEKLIMLCLATQICFAFVCIVICSFLFIMGQFHFMTLFILDLLDLRYFVGLFLKAS